MTSTQHYTHHPTQPSTQPTADIPGLRAACDQLIAAAPDPNATRALIVKVWAAGAATADDLLADLSTLAAHHAAHRGEQIGTADLLDALGRPAAAAHFRTAVQNGLDSHRRATAELARTTAAKDAARTAARTAARLLQTAQRRQASDVRTGRRTPPSVTGRGASARAVECETSSIALHA